MNDLPLYLRPLFLTLIIECAAAVIIFRVRRPEDIVVVILANIMTNPLLVYLSAVLVYHLGIDAGRCITYLALEPLVVMAEYVIYSRFLKKETGYLRMSVLLNIISITGGLICQRLI
ncbi:MAG: hypothetical protein K6F23_13820 [Solobacterium sp.]|nr:hypothetical protein [Solobacterium sp.]